MNSRYYNPNVGRFLTQDSYKGNPYDPWTQHLYSYAGNSPTNFVDPTGHYFTPPVLIDGERGIRPVYKPRRYTDTGTGSGSSSVTPEPTPTSTPTPTMGSGSGSGTSSGGGSNGGGTSLGGGGSNSWGGSESGDAELPPFLKFCGDCWYEQAKAEQQMAEYGAYVAMPAAIKSFRVDLGTGFGVLLSVSVPEIFELAGGWKTDIVHKRYDDGKWTAGSEIKSTLSVGIPNSASYGKYKSTYLTFDGQTIIEEEMNGIL